jgi:hypothetical protein
MRVARLLGRLAALAFLTAVGAAALALCQAPAPVSRVCGVVAMVFCVLGMAALAFGALREARRRANPSEVDQTAEERHT